MIFQLETNLKIKYITFYSIEHSKENMIVIIIVTLPFQPIIN